MPLDPVMAVGPTIVIIKETILLSLELAAVDTQALALLRQSVSIDQDIRHIQHLCEDAGPHLSAADQEWIGYKVQAAQDAFDDVGKIVRPLYADLVSRGSVAMGRRFKFVFNKDEVKPLLDTLNATKASLLATLPALNEACARKRAEQEGRSGNGNGNTIEIEHFTWTSANGTPWTAHNPAAHPPSASAIGVKKPKHRPSLSRSVISTGALYPPAAPQSFSDDTTIVGAHEPHRSSKLHNNLPKQDLSSSLAVQDTSPRLLAQTSSPDLRRANEAVASTINFASRPDLAPTFSDDTFQSSLHLPHEFYGTGDSNLPTYDEAVAQAPGQPQPLSRVTSFSRTRMSMNYSAASPSWPAAISEDLSDDPFMLRSTTPQTQHSYSQPATTSRKPVLTSTVAPVARAELSAAMLSPLDPPPQAAGSGRSKISVKRPKSRVGTQGPPR